MKPENLIAIRHQEASRRAGIKLGYQGVGVHIANATLKQPKEARGLTWPVAIGLGIMIAGALIAQAMDHLAVLQ